MSRQAQVGVLAILSLLLLFGIFYVITDYGTRHNGYRIGVHFDSAAGLTSGASVFFSGVTVGTVDSIVLLPDNSVDVVLAINRDVNIPKASRFLIQAPLTGSPSLLIVPPKPIPGVVPPPEAMLDRRVVPIAEQPKGYNSATVADLLDQGQGEIRHLDAMLEELAKREPKLLDSLQATLTNANRLTNTANASLADLSAQFERASNNVVALTGNLNDTVQQSSPRLSHIVDQLDQMSVALNKSSQQLEQLATNTELKSSLVATAKNIADTTQTISELTRDLRTVTGDPNTQAQLKNAVANVDAASQRANSILAGFGGTSCVYGIDACGTPAPPTVPGASPYPAAPYPPVPFPSPTASPHHGSVLSPAGQQQVRNLGGIVHNLVAIQLRMSGLSKQINCCLNPILSADRGPESDINAVLFANRGTGLLLGANNIGFSPTTANVAILERVAPYTHIGGGVLYSQLGVVAQYNRRTFGFEGYLYDPRYAMLDIYGNLAVAPGVRIFLGERDLIHIERRTTYGLQLQF